jgi:hypothetical protein
MTLLGLDLNASRARAVSGPVGTFPCPLPLDPPASELPLVIGLYKTAPRVGIAGVRLVRQNPQMAYHNFLSKLTEPPPQERQWFTRKRKLDAAGALGLVFQRLAPICNASQGVVLALPGYLNRKQIELVLSLGAQARLPLVGSLPAALAGALIAHAEQTWFGAALVVDIDDHAMTLTAINAQDGTAQLLETRVLPHLGLRVWKERLLNAFADCCVRQSRRDPRASPQAEQALYEQLDGVLDACRQGRLLQLALQGAQWYQNLIVSPEQPVAFCAALVQQLIQEVDMKLAAPWPDGPPTVLLTAAAGRMPGLVSSLRSFLQNWSAPVRGLRAAPPPEDFGEALFNQGPHDAPTTLLVLSADAPARGAHLIASFIHRGDLTAGHLDLVAPLPLPQPVEAGPPRLHFQGEDYFITGPSFTLGRQHGCHLVFDGNVYLTVAPRHCEIVFDHRSFVLYDHSREGTLVNDFPVSGAVALQPGDWLRLGPDGPVLRFLGQAPDFTPLQTTA